MNEDIDREALEALLKSERPPAVVEALPARYFETGHIPGAINIPHDEVATLAQSKLPNRQRTVVVYCANRACQNSAIASAALRGLGYADVREYIDGKEDWQLAGLPLERAQTQAA